MQKGLMTAVGGEDVIGAVLVEEAGGWCWRGEGGKDKPASQGNSVGLLAGGRS